MYTIASCCISVIVPATMINNDDNMIMIDSGHRSVTPPGLVREGSKTFFQNVHILVVEPDERSREELKTWLTEVLFRGMHATSTLF
jgi:translation initiation factor 2 beta subunit (eIF-2beta)/eIF-5